MRTTMADRDEGLKGRRPLTLDGVNAFGQAAFVERFGGTYEHSPWVAEWAWFARPFPSVDALHAAMERVVAAASDDERFTLICAHPELAGRLAQRRELTDASAAEQAQAGLHALTPELRETLENLNWRYREKFGFPFIICARLNDVGSILQAMRTRLGNGPETERRAALAEISKIARLRLAEAIA